MFHPKPFGRAVVGTLMKEEYRACPRRLTTGNNKILRKKRTSPAKQYVRDGPPASWLFCEIDHHINGWMDRPMDLFSVDSVHGNPNNV